MSKANDSVALMKQADPALARFFAGAVGYAVFPNVARGAIGVGGAPGSGVSFEGGTTTGKTRLSQVTVGFQNAGGK